MRCIGKTGGVGGLRDGAALLELANLPVPVGIDGKSLLALLDGSAAADRMSFAETLFHSEAQSPLASVSDGRYKLKC